MRDTDPSADRAVHLYQCTDEAPPSLVAAALARLDADECARAARRTHAAEHARFVLAHALVRVALSRHAPVAPGAWTFGAGPHGAPFVAGPDGAGDPRGLRFSLSHTRGCVLVAVTRGRAVGVDVEWTGRAPTPQVARRACAAEEQQLLAALPDAARHVAFLARWTVKEAYVKARGLGLLQPLHHVVVTSIAPGTDAPPAVHFHAALDDRVDAWQFVQVCPGPDHVAALAIAHEGAPLPVVRHVVPAAALTD